MKLLVVVVFALGFGSSSATPLLGNVLKTVNGLVPGLLDNLLPAIQEVLGSVTLTVTGLGVDVVDIVGELVSPIQDILGSLVEIVQNIVDSATRAVAGVVAAAVRALLAQLVCAVLELLAAIIPTVQDLVGTINNTVQDIVRTLGSAAAEVLVIVSEVLDKLIRAVDGLTGGALSRLLISVKTAVDNLLDELNDLLQILLLNLNVTGDQILNAVINIVGNFQGAVGNEFKC